MSKEEAQTESSDDDSSTFSEEFVNEQNPQVFEKAAELLNVVDVYNIASSVGQEFERLTDAFGGAVFVGVMPKIIRILELLETFAAQNVGGGDKMTELAATVQKLQLDSRLKDQKQQEEIEIVEAAWKDETRGLMETVATLEEDNRKLTLLLTEKMEEENANMLNFIPSEQQGSSVSKLQEQIQKQRDEIRARNRIIEEKNAESEATCCYEYNNIHPQLQLQVNRMGKLNVEVRRKITILEQQGKNLIQQKSELESRLQGQPALVTDMKISSSPHPKPVKTEAASCSTQDDKWPGDPLLANKLVIDLSDPNRPRYTLQELQEVLNDRNKLKARCFLLEEELRYFKGDDSWEELGDAELQQSKQQSEKNNNLPQQSGIRRFFSYITGGGGEGLWKRNEVTKETSPKRHQVVEEDNTNLLDTDDLDQLIPDLTVPPAQDMTELGASSC
uniref:RILP-like protein 1 isoform X2 n=1 Tax=Ciona intestinalis TaxID=7719 RepID=UPI000EF47184|nr:RILP-like protein 1 isoform X2 [Ciona intestinalis]|eukprot:XP_026689814.1 RILP-like protein 1 isoform X2 [Ciona intestinalis]